MTASASISELIFSMSRDMACRAPADFADFRSVIELAGAPGRQPLDLYPLWGLSMKAGQKFTQALIEAGAPVNDAPKGHEPPLALAVRHAADCHPQARAEFSWAVAALLAAGASPNALMALNDPGLAQLPCLARALESRAPEAASLLIQAGADLHWAHPQTGAGYLHYAAGYDAPDALAALLVRGADPGAVCSLGMTPLQLAEMLCQTRCVEVLRAFLEARELEGEAQAPSPAPRAPSL